MRSVRHAGRNVTYAHYRPELRWLSSSILLFIIIFFLFSSTSFVALHLDQAQPIESNHVDKHIMSWGMFVSKHSFSSMLTCESSSRPIVAGV